eukprot:TRINITY_DN2377_c0_g2_i1.p1 TRINITY_DN2377_c0_g2~~TRINITY_DN2377_c0_g2_i1.p1  ORF type:complete len:126 (+),score=14.89 TRINITY_DN2377_c0_g2_i1:171-548(+)
MDSNLTQMVAVDSNPNPTKMDLNPGHVPVRSFENFKRSPIIFQNYQNSSIRVLGVSCPKVLLPFHCSIYPLLTILRYSKSVTSFSLFHISIANNPPLDLMRLTFLILVQVVIQTLPEWKAHEWDK